jgi:hypothetical protein
VTTIQLPVAEITAQARQVRPAAAAVNLAAFLLIWVGRLLGYAWLIPVWCFLAVRTGWHDVHPKVSSEVRPAG